jgi:hypothetical protein
LLQLRSAREFPTSGEIFQPENFRRPNLDDVVKSRESIEFGIPANPGPDPEFAGATVQETFYEIIIFER